MQTSFDFKGLNAVVTGGAGGISLEVASSLCKFGAHAVILDVNEEKGNAAAESLRKEGLSVEFRKVDLSQEESAMETFAKLKGELKHIDILFNGAGIMDSNSMFETPLAAFKKVLNINLFGAYVATRAVLEGMIERNYGRIVNVTSAYSNGVKNSIGYSVSKGGISSMTRSLAAEMREEDVDVCVNAISPPATDTALWEGSRSKEVIEKHRKVKDIAQPSDLVNTVMFLCSPEARYVSGEIIGFKHSLSKLPDSRA